MRSRLDFTFKKKPPSSFPLFVEQNLITEPVDSLQVPNRCNETSAERILIESAHINISPNTLRVSSVRLDDTVVQHRYLTIQSRENIRRTIFSTVPPRTVQRRYVARSLTLKMTSDDFLNCAAYFSLFDLLITFIAIFFAMYACFRHYEIRVSESSSSFVSRCQFFED